MIDRRMNQFVLALVMMVTATIIGLKPSMADDATESTAQLATCLADHTTGKQRKTLAQWVFVGMSAHPEIHGMSNVAEADRDAIDKEMAAMMTALLTEDCLSETQLAIQKGGRTALNGAFSIIGKLAFQELMTSQEVNTAFQQYIKYIDREKFRALSQGE